MLTRHIRENLQVTPGPFPDFWVGPGDEATPFVARVFLCKNTSLSPPPPPISSPPHTHTHIDLMANISMNRYRFPSKEDYSGAITAIHRLQDTYQLQPSVIASGKLGSSSAFPMTGNKSLRC